jgi:hypothetical protein
MLADKTLLGATLVVTFLSGGTVGYLARDAEGVPPQRPYAVETVFAHQLEGLQLQGYDEPELGEARVIYADYLDKYQMWWNQFVESHVDNLDRIDTKMAESLKTLDERHRARAAGSSSK